MGMTVIFVAIGGGLGAALRFIVALWVNSQGNAGFPLGILAVNIIGSFLMGALVVFLGQKGLTHLNPFFLTGLLGGFTTFSAFSLEAYTLFERGAVGQAGLYVGLSVVLSILSLVLGVWMMRSILA